MTIEEAGGKEVAGGSRIDHLRHRLGTDGGKIFTTARHGTVSAGLHHGHGAQGGQLVECLTGFESRKGAGLLLVGKDDVRTFEQVAKEVAFGLHNVVTGQIQADLQATTFRQFHRAGYEVVILHQIALYI